MGLQPAFQGEVMLAGWSETHNGGAKVTFWLQDSDDLEAFKVMTVAKGKTAGQRLALVAVEIGDDEQPVSRRTGPGGSSVQPANNKAKGGELARLAGQLCQNLEFRECFGFNDEHDAAERIRFACEIQSRAELDHNFAAAELFHKHFRIPFLKWKESRHEHKGHVHGV